MAATLAQLQDSLHQHALFKELKTLTDVRFFMESHVYAVWDFMSLLKRLQRDITCVAVPWRPSPYPDSLVRFINEIVVGEESDVDQHGRAAGHFNLYLTAMEEVGASTAGIRRFLQTLDLNEIPAHVRPFTAFTLETAQHAPLVEVAAAFFYGREKLIPGMFESIISTLEAHKVDCPTLMYYLVRHVHVDGGEHGPLSEMCLEALCAGHQGRQHEALEFGRQALQERLGLWDRTLERMRT